MFAPQTLDLLEKLALIFLYNFYRDHISLKLKIKKLSPKINGKTFIRTRVKDTFSPTKHLTNPLFYMYRALALVSISLSI